jgi:hypothetical protein
VLCGFSSKSTCGDVANVVSPWWYPAMTRFRFARWLAFALLPSPGTFLLYPPYSFLADVILTVPIQTLIPALRSLRLSPR